MLIPNIKSKQRTYSFDISRFVEWWNINFPLDKWYRSKYNIRWGSVEHRQVTLLSIGFEYEEELIFKNLGEQVELSKNKVKYTPGDWFNSDGEEIEENLFDRIDITKIGDGEADIDLAQE